jgi:hypothetical protein
MATCGYIDTIVEELSSASVARVDTAYSVRERWARIDITWSSKAKSSISAIGARINLGGLHSAQINAGLKSNSVLREEGAITISTKSALTIVIVALASTIWSNHHGASIPESNDVAAN